MSPEDATALFATCFVYVFGAFGVAMAIESGRHWNPSRRMPDDLSNREIAVAAAVWPLLILMVLVYIVRTYPKVMRKLSNRASEDSHE